jgi:large subunit ribosomal protein L17
MRHRVAGKKLGRNGEQRKALRLLLSSALLQHGRIETTQARAAFIRGDVERLITLAKRSQQYAESNPARVVHAMRIAASRLNNDRELVQKLFNEIAPRFQNRPGGYTRVLKLGPRKGDAAEMVLLELTERGE